MILAQPFDWTADINSFKLNFDAQEDKPRNKGTIAVVARDHSGTPIFWLCKLVLGRSDPLILEALACKEATDLAVLQNLDEACVERDFLAVIQAVKGPIKLSKIFRILLKEGCLLASHMSIGRRTKLHIHLLQEPYVIKIFCMILGTRKLFYCSMPI